MDWVGINAKLSQLLGVGSRINRLVIRKYRAPGTDLCQVPWQRGIVFAKDD